MIKLIIIFIIVLIISVLIIGFLADDNSQVPGNSGFTDYEDFFPYKEKDEYKK